jgi:hypothetical protein
MCQLERERESEIKIQDARKTFHLGKSVSERKKIQNFYYIFTENGSICVPLLLFLLLLMKHVSKTFPGV